MPVMLQAFTCSWLTVGPFGERMNERSRKAARNAVSKAASDNTKPNGDLSTSPDTEELKTNGRKGLWAVILAVFRRKKDKS